MQHRWKYVGIGLMLAGWLTVIGIDKGYAALGDAYWLIGGGGLAVSVVGGIMTAWADRRWPEPRPDQTSHSK